MTVRTKRRNEACPLDPDCFVQLTTSKKHWPDINAKPPNDPNQAADRTSSERYPAISVVFHPAVFRTGRHCTLAPGRGTHIYGSRVSRPVDVTATSRDRSAGPLF